MSNMRVEADEMSDEMKVNRGQSDYFGMDTKKRVVASSQIKIC